MAWHGSGSGTGSWHGPDDQPARFSKGPGGPPPPGHWDGPPGPGCAPPAPGYFHGHGGPGSDYRADDGPRQAYPPGGEQVYSSENQEEKIMNDCEILLMTKPGDPSYDRDKVYSEEVEKQIKSIGIRVDMIFPRESTKLTALMEALAKKGTIFAVVIRPDNAAHRSLTMYVLRGVAKPEEHRNMTLNLALTTMHKIYCDLQRQEIGICPDHLKIMMQEVQDDKALNDTQLAALVAYFSERRRRLAAFDARLPFNDDESPCYTNEELQHKILQLLCMEGSRGTVP